jgi:hypothetical protein
LALQGSQAGFGQAGLAHGSQESACFRLKSFFHRLSWESQHASQPPLHELVTVGAAGAAAAPAGGASAPASQAVVTSKNAAFTSKTSAKGEGWLWDQGAATKLKANVRRPIRARIHELFRNRQSQASQPESTPVH